MHVKMHHNDSLDGMMISILGFIFSKIFLLLQLPTLANISSIFVIIGVVWTFIANSDKAISNIKKFYEWFKTKK